MSFKKFFATSTHDSESGEGWGLLRQSTYLLNIIIFWLWSCRMPSNPKKMTLSLYINSLSFAASKELYSAASFEELEGLTDVAEIIWVDDIAIDAPKTFQLLASQSFSTTMPFLVYSIETKSDVWWKVNFLLSYSSITLNSSRRNCSPSGIDSIPFCSHMFFFPLNE